MNVVFRVDSSLAMGSGHVMRCLVLAKELRARGADVHFICRDHPGNIISLIKNSFFRVTVLAQPDEVTLNVENEYASWLGVGIYVDSEQTIAAIGCEGVDWLIVDHYSIDNRWHSVLRGSTKHICVIDDLANRTHDCDILLDSNYTDLSARRYATRTPYDCNLLLGPRYALLSKSYQSISRMPRQRDGSIKNILIYFGGSDHYNMTGRCLEALSLPEFIDISIDVVIGPMNPHHELLNDFTTSRKNIRLHMGLPNLASLINTADLGIGAAGVTTWERMCLGLPSIIVTIAENQKPAAIALARDNYISYLGEHSDVTIASIREAVVQKISDQKGVVAEVARAMSIVDGCGVNRVVEFIYPTNIRNVSLEHLGERVLPRSLGLNPTVSNQPVSVTKVDLFTSNLKQSCEHLMQFHIGVLSLGYVFFSMEENGIRVQYNFDDLVISRGWDAKFLGKAVRALDQNFALIDSQNIKIKDQSIWNNYLYMCPESHELSKESGLKIAILSHPSSWLNEYIYEILKHWLDQGHEVLWVHDKLELVPGDFCFYLGCEQIVSQDILCQFKNNLVVHESDLPLGRGWSPLTWQIIQGTNSIPIILFEAAESLDAGKVYIKDVMTFTGVEVIQEIRSIQGSATINLCKQFVDEYPSLVINAKDQVGEPTFYDRRTPIDSYIDANDTVKAAFPILRVSDYERYPAFFNIDGVRFKIKIEML